MARGGESEVEARWKKGNKMEGKNSVRKGEERSKEVKTFEGEFGFRGKWGVGVGGERAFKGSLKEEEEEEEREGK